MKRALGLDCKGYEAFSFIKRIVGLGRPLAVRLKVTDQDTLVLWRLNDLRFLGICKLTEREFILS